MQFTQLALSWIKYVFLILNLQDYQGRSQKFLIGEADLVLDHKIMVSQIPSLHS